MLLIKIGQAGLIFSSGKIELDVGLIWTVKVVKVDQ